MAITRVQLNTGASGTASVAVAFGSNNTAGNLLIAAVASETDAATLTSIVDSAGNTWTQANATLSIGGGKGTGFGFFYAKNCAAGANTVTVTLSGGAVYLHIFEYSGCDTTAPLDVKAEAFVLGGGATPSSGSATTTNANDLLLGFVYNNRSTLTAGTGYTVISTRIFSNFSNVEEQIVSATGSYVADGTITTGGSWYAALATFKQAGGGGGGPSTAAKIRYRSVELRLQ